MQESIIELIPPQHYAKVNMTSQTARITELEDRIRQAEETAQRAKWDQDTMFANLQEQMTKVYEQTLLIKELVSALENVHLMFETDDQDNELIAKVKRAYS